MEQVEYRRLGAPEAVEVEDLAGRPDSSARASTTERPSSPPAARSVWARVKRGLFLVGLALTLALTVIHLLYYFPRTVDDMFIFLRYAENLANGHGLVYNPGMRQEGFSSPLWVTLLTLGELLGQGGVTFAKLLALGALVGLYTGLYRFAREALGLSAPAGLFVLAFMAVNSYLISWTLWGLETPAYLALMVWSAILLRRQLIAPSRRRLIAFIAVGAAFSLCRPEAPLFMAAIAVALLVEPLRRSEIVRRFRRLAVPALGVGAIFAGYVVFRRLYYGLWLPHTYYAKRGHGFETEHWEAIWNQGASRPEAIFIVVGAALAVWLLARRVSAVPLFVSLATLLFVAQVELDWMPNQRHFLPIWVFIPLAWAAAADAGARWAASRRTGVLRATVGMIVLCTTLFVSTRAGTTLLGIDARYSPEDHHLHGRDEEWIIPKTIEAMRDSWLCLSREMPQHVLEMGPFHMGMISQVFRLIETDMRPLDKSWYIGRDIGRVGWLAPVLMFDTDGLFTPEVVNDPDWQDDESISQGLIDWAFDRRVIMSELIDYWRLAAVQSHFVRDRYETLVPGDWAHFWPKDRLSPTPTQIIQRYEYALSRLPQSYYVMTLYGEAVGAALERRVRIVRREMRDNMEIRALEVPDDLVGGAVVLDDEVEYLGCHVDQTVAAPSQELLFDCYFRVLHRPRKAYDIFVHVEWVDSDFRLVADHAPAALRLPARQWRVGEIIHDAFRVLVPYNAPSGRVRTFVGLFTRGGRARAEPIGLVEPATLRPYGPQFTVQGGEEGVEDQEEAEEAPSGGE